MARKMIETDWLLDIENQSFVEHLKEAVSFTFLIFLPNTSSLSHQSNYPINHFPHCLQGFSNFDLTHLEAVAIIKNAKWRLGYEISKSDINEGKPKDLLIPSDYDIVSKIRSTYVFIYLLSQHSNLFPFQYS